jgi:hypothetical protein
MSLSPRPPVNTPSWRKSPFKSGQNYVVLKDFNSTSGAFRFGETLKFSHEEWLIDQSLTSYFFADESDVLRCWEVYDEEDLSRWAMVFAPVPNPSPSAAHPPAF